MKKYLIVLTLLFFAISITVAVSVMASATSAIDKEKGILYKIEFSRDDLSFSHQNNYDVAMLKSSTSFTRDVGKPQIPYKVLQFAIPKGQKIAGIKILSDITEELPGTYIMYPAQESHPMSEEWVFTKPDSSAYSSSIPYPVEIVAEPVVGFMAGVDIATILLHPLQYVPSEKKLILHKKIKFKIIYAKDVSKDVSAGAKINNKKRSKKAKTIRDDFLKKMVLNPGYVETNAAEVYGVYEAGAGGVILQGGSAPASVDYLIITSQELADSGEFQPFLDSKVAKGLAVHIEAVSWIENNSQGRDTQEKIRNYIKDLFQNNGLVYVLLGGDVDVVPTREFMNESAGGGKFSSDFYYANLDGTMDADGDGIYGEPIDEVDYFPDVFIGRAPVETLEEVQVFVNKVLSYEGVSMDDPILKKMLFLGCSDFGNTGEIVKERIARDYIQPDIYEITKYYEHYISGGYISETISAIEEGTHLVNHIDHGSIDVWRLGDDDSEKALYIDDVQALQNSNYPVIFTVSCFSNAFDNPYMDVISEEFMLNSHGGSAAYVGNTNFGICPESDTMLDPELFEALMVKGYCHIGQTLAELWTTYGVQAQYNASLSYALFAFNLLGDPEMEIKIPSDPLPLVDNIKKIIDDEEGGNGDGIIAPGETIKLTAIMKALNINAENVGVTLSVHPNDQDYVEIVNGSSYYGTILNEQAVSNEDDPFEFSVSTDLPPGNSPGCYTGYYIKFDMTITADNYSRESVLTVYVPTYWPFTRYGQDITTSVIADIDKNGKMEVIFGLENDIICLNNTAQEKWRYHENEESIMASRPGAPPVLVDINGDGYKEVIFATKGHWMSGGYVYCLNHEGNKLWSPQSFEDTSFRNSLAVSDIDDDGNKEIIALSEEGTVFCLDAGNGMLKWQYEVEGQLFSMPAVYDVDLDGFKEIIFGSSNGVNSKVYCLKNTGDELIWSFDIGSPVVSAVVMSELTGTDYYKNIIVATADGRVLYISRAGDLIWEYDTGSPIYSSPAVADIGGDDSLEVVVGTTDGKLYAINAEGDAFWSTPFEIPSGRIGSSPIIVDFTRSGINHIIVGSNTFDNDDIYCIDGEKTIKWQFHRDEEVSEYEEFSAADIDGDGNMEVFFTDISYNPVTGGAYHMHCVDKDGNVALPPKKSTGYYDPAPWPSLRGNECNTGFLKHLNVIGPPHQLFLVETFDEEEAGNAEIVITKNTPDKEITKGFLSFNSNQMRPHFWEFLTGDETVLRKEVTLELDNSITVFLGQVQVLPLRL